MVLCDKCGSEHSDAACPNPTSSASASASTALAAAPTPPPSSIFRIVSTIVPAIFRAGYLAINALNDVGMIMFSAFQNSAGILPMAVAFAAARILFTALQDATTRVVLVLFQSAGTLLSDAFNLPSCSITVSFDGIGNTCSYVFTLVTPILWTILEVAGIVAVGLIRVIPILADEASGEALTLLTHAFFDSLRIITAAFFQLVTVLIAALMETIILVLMALAAMMEGFTDLLDAHL